MATSKITLGEPKVGKTHGIQIRVIYYWNTEYQAFIAK